MVSKSVLGSAMYYVMSGITKCCFLLVIVGVFSGEICSGKRIEASFVFGDSLVDVGNNNYIVTLSQANHAPNGVDLLPSRQPTGRFTNGRTIADILGQELGLETPPPYLAPTTTGSVVLKGVNYASGAAGILNETGAVFGGRINFDAQLDDYANTRHDIINMLGKPAAVSLLRNSLFSVTMGSNDFVSNYFVPVLSIPERVTISPDMFVEKMITRNRQQLTRLYNLDARKIVIINIGPIGCIPFLRDTYPLSGTTSCVELANQLAQNFNNRLKDLVMELTSSLQGVHFAYGNSYGIVSDIIQNYKSYGFENVNSACCAVIGRYGGLIPCGAASKVCADRSKYFFWDPYHPSDAANVIIAKRLLDGDSNDIFPVNVRQLVQL